MEEKEKVTAEEATEETVEETVETEGQREKCWKKK